MDMFDKITDSSTVLFETLPCRVSSSTYFKVIFSQLFAKWWSVMLLLLIAFVGATCYNLRFGIVLLIFLFFIVPLVIFFLYYNYALRPEAFYSVVEKVVMIKNDGLYCTYNEQERSIVKWSQVMRVVKHQQAFFIFTGENTYFYLPREAFMSKEDEESFEKKYLPIFIS